MSNSSGHGLPLSLSLVLLCWFCLFSFSLHSSSYFGPNLFQRLLSRVNHSVISWNSCSTVSFGREICADDGHNTSEILSKPC